MRLCLRRREFIAALGGAAAWPLAARAQQRTMPVVGYLEGGSPEPSRVVAFHKGLSETGYVEGRNVATEYRWAHNELDRLSELAADLVRRRVSVIVTLNTIEGALAAKALTTTIWHHPRPCPIRPSREPQPARWQCHRFQQYAVAAWRKAAWALARTHTRSRTLCRAHKSRWDDY